MAAGANAALELPVYLYWRERFGLMTNESTP